MGAAYFAGAKRSGKPNKPLDWTIWTSTNGEASGFNWLKVTYTGKRPSTAKRRTQVWKLTYHRGSYFWNFPSSPWASEAGPGRLTAARGPSWPFARY